MLFCNYYVMLHHTVLISMHTKTITPALPHYALSFISGLGVLLHMDEVSQSIMKWD